MTKKLTTFYFLLRTTDAFAFVKDGRYDKRFDFYLKVVSTGVKSEDYFGLDLLGKTQIT